MQFPCNMFSFLNYFPNLRCLLYLQCRQVFYHCWFSLAKLFLIKRNTEGCIFSALGNTVAVQNLTNKRFFRFSVRLVSNKNSKHFMKYEKI